MKGHPEYLIEKARKALYNIKNKLSILGETKPNIIFHLYESMIKPIITYGSELWGHNKYACKQVDNSFLWFARCVLRVKRNTSNLITLGECGIFPPSVYCHISCILYMLRLKSMCHDKILSEVYEESIHYQWGRVL